MTEEDVRRIVREELDRLQPFLVDQRDAETVVNLVWPALTRRIDAALSADMAQIGIKVP
jgi:hypothetical protein